MVNEYIEKRMKELGFMLANYEDHRDSMDKDEDTSYYDKLVLVGRARIQELERLKKYLTIEKDGLRNSKYTIKLDIRTSLILPFLYLKPRKNRHREY